MYVCAQFKDSVVLWEKPEEMCRRDNVTTKIFARPCHTNSSVGFIRACSVYKKESRSQFMRCLCPLKCSFLKFLRHRFILSLVLTVSVSRSPFQFYCSGRFKSTVLFIRATGPYRFRIVLRIGKISLWWGLRVYGGGQFKRRDPSLIFGSPASAASRSREFISVKWSRMFADDLMYSSRLRFTTTSHPPNVTNCSVNISKNSPAELFPTKPRTYRIVAEFTPRTIANLLQFGRSKTFYNFV